MCFSELSGCNLIGLSSSIAIAISENLSVDEITSLAAFVNALADNLSIIATQKSIQEQDVSPMSKRGLSPIGH